ncbi:oxidoreductase-like protein [Amylocystis lapponica]|nr:oxidoreductase-like protein [Amylocystis lapponica]
MGASVDTATLAPRSLTAFPASSPSPSSSASVPRIHTSDPSSVVAIQQQKYPTRGGQNLSARYRRLERSLRGKKAYGARITELAEDAQDIADAHPETPHAASKPRAGANMFMGFVIPQEPRAPESDECCMSGCAICVYDLYADALEDYKRSVDMLRTGLSARHIPEEVWPPQIRQGTAQDEKKTSTRNVSMDAFEALERSLREKHVVESQGSG